MPDLARQAQEHGNLPTRAARGLAIGFTGPGQWLGRASDNLLAGNTVFVTALSEALRRDSP